MPFKSKAQVKTCYAKHDKNWDCEKWMKETPNKGKDLPKKKPATKARSKSR